MTRRPPDEDSDPFGEDASEEAPRRPGPGKRPRQGKGPPSDSDLIKFPFGESDDGTPDEESDADDLTDSGDLTDSDLGGSDMSEPDSTWGRLLESDDPGLQADHSTSGSGASGASGLIMADTGEILPDEPAPRRRKGPPGGKGAPGKPGKLPLPSVPPGSRPEDDASLDGLASDQGAADSSDEELEELSGPSDLGPVSDLGTLSVTERLGAVGPSGPLVIVDDEGDADASMRFRASVVDDSARLAGSQGSMRARRRTGQRPAEWSEEEEPDPDAPVPTPSMRKGATRTKSGERSKSGARTKSGERSKSGERTGAAPPPPRRGPWAVLAALLLGAAAAGGVQELRWRALERDARQRADEALLAERTAGKQALEAAEQRGAEAARQASEAGGRVEAAEAALARGEAAAREREASLKAAAAAEVRAAEEAAQARVQEAVEVELATARRQAEAERQRVVDEAVQAEQARGQEALRELARSEEQRRREELDALRQELAAELSGAPTRADEEALGEELAAARRDALDQVAPPGGGGAGGGGGDDDWEAMFDDFGSGGSGDGGSGGAGGEEDLFAVGGDEQVGAIEGAWRWARRNVHGFIAYRNLSHFSRGEFRDLRKTRHEVRIRLSYADWLWRSEDALTGLRLVAALDIRDDDDDFTQGWPENVDDDRDNRPHVWPEELYLGGVHDWLELRAGWQRYAWGTGDLFNPTDNLNPIDFSDLFDPRRISVLSASARVQVDPLSLELVSIPTFTRTRIPLSGKRFDLLRGAPITVLRPDDPDLQLENMQWAARAVVRKFGWDVSISGFTGWDDIPSAALNTISVFPPLFQAVTRFERLHVLGLDFATTLGFMGIEGPVGDFLSRIQLHGEAAHSWHEGERLDDYVQYVVGINYQVVDIIFEHDLTIILEYAGDYRTHAAEQPFPGVNLGRIFRGAVLFRLQYDVNEELSFELNGAVMTHGDENVYLRPGVTWKPTDWLSLELMGDVFLGPDETFFGQFERDGRVITTLKFSF